MSDKAPFEWGDIAAAVAAQLGLRTNRSPTLTRVVEQGVRYAVVSDGQLVFDTRALFLGFLAAGGRIEGSIRYGSAASWLRDWLEQRFPNLGIADTLASSAPNLTRPAFQEIVLSISVRGLLEPAGRFAQRTNDRAEYEARHLLAAMIVKGVVTDQVSRLYRQPLARPELDALCDYLVEQVIVTAEKDETAARWRTAFAEAWGDAKGEPDADAPPSAGHVVPFSRDRGDGGGDLLQTAADARALARLICLREAAPLALAIFGGWGSGKSTFMERIDNEVRGIAEGALRQPDGSPFVSRVVQIRFNAWQFVDANLWASLTAEFFDQLRAGGWEQLPGQRHASLVERVNSHVHALNTDAQARREAAAKGGQKVAKAQSERDAAAKTARSAGSKALGQAGIDLLGDLYESQKSNLAALGWAVAGVDVEKSVAALVETARTSGTIGGQIKSVWTFLSKSRERLLVATVFAVIAAYTAWWLYSSDLQAKDLLAASVAALTALGWLGSLAAALKPALKVVGVVSARAAEIAGTIDDKQKAATETLLLREIELRDATAEAEALRKAAERADQALARYIDPQATSNPPRLLRYVLEDDPDTRALTAEIGLIGRTRRLFQAVDEIVRAEKEKSPANRLDGDVPDRIVLYIDDLDRCTPEQVYAVLQAIHLLLAFELFVVVVGVDVAWIQYALNKQFGDKDDPDQPSGQGDQAASRSRRAMLYLEKIFQIGFWLGPLSDVGEDGGSFGRYVRALAGEALPAPPSPRSAAPSQSEAPASAGSGEAHSEEVVTAPSTPAQPPPVVETIEAARAMRLEPQEIAFLASPAVGALAASTPRGAKRLVNIYRLVRSQMLEQGDPVLGEGGKPPIYPLIAIAVALETGRHQDAAEHLHKGLCGLPANRMISALAFNHSEGHLAEMEKAIAEPIMSMRAAHAKFPALDAAFNEAERLMGPAVTAGPMLEVLVIARRYSFHGGL